MKKIGFYINILFLLLVLVLTGCSSRPFNALETDAQSDLTKAAQLNIKLGLAYLEQGQVSRAKSKFNRAMKLAPQLSEAHYGMAFYFDRVGEIEAARKAYKQSITLNPNGGIEHNNYGAFLCRQKEYRASEKEFLKALKDPEYTNAAQALENAGLCVLEIPDEVNAVQYFKSALSHDPKLPNALIELAYIQYLHNDFETAMNYYLQYNQIADPIPRSLWLGIKLAQRTGDKNKVSSDLLLLKDRFPHSKEYKDLLKNEL